MFLFVLYTLFLAEMELFCSITGTSQNKSKLQKTYLSQSSTNELWFFPLPDFLLSLVRLILCCSAPCVGVYTDAKRV